MKGAARSAVLSLGEKGFANGSGKLAGLYRV